MWKFLKDMKSSSSVALRFRNLANEIAKRVSEVSFFVSDLWQFLHLFYTVRSGVLFSRLQKAHYT